MNAKNTTSKGLIDEYQKEFYDRYEAPGYLRIEYIRTL